MSTNNNFGSNFVTVVSFYLQNHEYGFFMLGDTCGSFDTAGQPYPTVLNELDIVESFDKTLKSINDLFRRNILNSVYTGTFAMITFPIIIYLVGTASVFIYLVGFKHASIYIELISDRSRSGSHTIADFIF